MRREAKRTVFETRKERTDGGSVGSDDRAMDQRVRLARRAAIPLPFAHVASIAQFGARDVFTPHRAIGHGLSGFAAGLRRVVPIATGFGAVLGRGPLRAEIASEGRGAEGEGQHAEHRCHQTHGNSFELGGFRN